MKKKTGKLRKRREYKKQKGIPQTAIEGKKEKKSHVGKKVCLVVNTLDPQYKCAPPLCFFSQRKIYLKKAEKDIMQVNVTMIA